MIEITNLAPHDPMPGGPDRQVVVLRRFEEDEPGRTTIQIILTGTPEESTHPRRADGTPMSMSEAVDAAKRVAESEGINRVFVLDRAKGEREQAVLREHGDHTVDMETLSDTDEEDGVKGSDMRDVLHRTDDR